MNGTKGHMDKSSSHVGRLGGQEKGDQSRPEDTLLFLLFVVRELIMLLSSKCRTRAWGGGRAKGGGPSGGVRHSKEHSCFHRLAMWPGCPQPKQLGGLGKFL